ncbi:hypothetical protein GCM10027596_22200 [Nocardioides korecus]
MTVGTAPTARPRLVRGSRRLSAATLLALAWLALAEPLRATGAQGALTLGLALVLLAVTVLGSGRHQVGGTGPTRFLWAFVAYALLSCLWHPLTRQGAQNVAVYICFASSVSVAMRGAAESMITRLKAFRLAALVGVVPSALVSAQHERSDLRIIGTGALPLVATIGLLVTVLLPRSRWRLVFSAVFFVIVLFSLSRELIAIAVVLLTMPTLGADGADSRAAFRRWLGRGVVLGALAWWALSQYQPLRERFAVNDGGALLGVDIGTSGRLRIWGSVESAFELGHKLLGNGAGGSEQVVTNTYVVITQPHNDYLRLLYDFGIVGVTLWVLALVQLTWTGLTVVRRAEGARDVRRGLVLISSVALIILTSLLDNTIVYVFAMIPLGVLIGSALRPDEPGIRPDDVRGARGAPR